MTPERRLMAAVLGQALHDVSLEPGPRSSKMHLRLYREAVRWMVSADRSWQYSFLNICDVLDVSPVLLRAEFLGRGARRSKLRCAA